MAKADIIAAMHYYVDLGMPVIPICPSDPSEHVQYTSPKHKTMCKCDGKVPLIAGWTHRAETTLEHVKDWIKQFPAMNVGLPLGESSGYCGLDIDGEEGEEILMKMSGGDIPDTWEYVTGAGRRLLYRIPVGMKTKKFKETGNGVHTECAILCQGQQTVLPPSTHKSGINYQWCEDHSPKDIDCAMAPKWLLDYIRLDETTLRRPSMKIDLSKDIPEVFNFDDEFTATEFSSELPPEAQDTKAKKVKAQTVNESAIAALLYQPISEGSRDNTMTQIIGHFLSKPEYRAIPVDMFTNLMLDYNVKYCDPPLDPEAIKTKVTYFVEIEAQKSAKYKEQSSQKDWVAGEIVQMILNRLEDDGYIIRYDQSKQNYYYCNKGLGPWREDTEGMIEGKVWGYLQDPTSGDPKWGTRNKLLEAMDALELELRMKGFSKGQMFDLNKNSKKLLKYIVVDGKLLDWQTGEILPWDTGYYSTINFMVNYDPTAKCPNWEKYMKEWLPDESLRNLLQEFMGSALLPEPAPAEKFIILTGSGSNGKSMFLKGMQNIFEEYAVALTPQRLSERFGTSALYGALVNICSEIEGDGGKIKNTAQLKSIVSGEPLTAEYKGKDAFKFKPVTNLIFSANQVPRSMDKSDGWYRRQIIVPFEQKFQASQAAGARMERHMIEEIPGIFNWLLEGLRRVKQRGYFIITERLQEVQDEFRASSDPLQGFLKDCIITAGSHDLSTISGKSAKNQGVSATIVQEMYNIWCKYSYGDKANNYKQSPRNFNTNLEGKGLKKIQGICVYKKAKTSILSNILLQVNNPELIEVMKEECSMCSVTEPGYFLHELAKAAERELKESEE